MTKKINKTLQSLVPNYSATFSENLINISQLPQERPENIQTKQHLSLPLMTFVFASVFVFSLSLSLLVLDSAPMLSNISNISDINDVNIIYNAYLDDLYSSYSYFDIGLS